MSYRIIGIANNVSRNDSAPLWINDCCVQFLNSKEVTSNSLLYNFVNSESICFTLTSKCQPSCADDLLYPFDRYDHDIIFPNGDEDSSKFLEMCKEQLQVLVRKFTFDVTTEPETDISGGGPVGPGGTIEITEGNVVLGATTCSVTITVTDINIADAKYRYYISEYPDVYDSYIETSRPSHTIENLKQDTQYYEYR